MENGQARVRHLATNIVVIQGEYTPEYTVIGPHNDSQLIFFCENPRKGISEYIKKIKTYRENTLDYCDALDRHFTSEGATILTELERT